MPPKKKNSSKTTVAVPAASSTTANDNKHNRSSLSQSNVPLELQQAILNIFSTALFTSGLHSGMQAIVQEVKGHLFRRDFCKAFGRSDYLEAYALRWSASRALAYADILASVELADVWRTAQTSEHGTVQVTALGGGAGAELIACSAIVRLLGSLCLDIRVIDIADWNSVLQRLLESATSPPKLSEHASETAKSTNSSMVLQSQLRMKFDQQDILDQSEEELTLALAASNLVTIMFTLNELFAKSMSQTTRFLLQLTAVVKPESYLLIVDSPGQLFRSNIGHRGPVQEISYGYAAQSRPYEGRERQGRSQVGTCQFLQLAMVQTRLRVDLSSGPRELAISDTSIQTNGQMRGEIQCIRDL